MAIIEKHIAAELFLQNDKTQKKRNTNLVDVEKKQEDFDSSGESDEDEKISILMRQMMKICHTSKYILNKMNSFEIRSTISYELCI